ncbi:MAG: hypothetical protein ACHBN1_07290 [Heteroscytonema crispum UTEX LB 1556]
MSTSAAVKTSGLRQRYAIAGGVGGVISLLIMLSGCSVPGFNAITWKTYSNSRYGFEFPYPSSWTSLPPPENDDGIAFVSPQNNTVEIRGWAGNRLPESIDKDAKKTINSNFKTAQGVSGVLVVEVGSKVSLMTLSISQSKVKYNWQGRSPSEDFQDYYRVFYYIAQQYRITSPES